jgi:hypothetical protein
VAGPVGPGPGRSGWRSRPTNLRASFHTRPGQEFLKPLRQIIESIFDTLKGQLDLECHAGRTLAGVSARFSQRLLA